MMARRSVQWNMKGKKPTLKQFACVDCGDDFWRTANVAKYCDRCRDERMEENKARAMESRVPSKAGGHRNDAACKVVVEFDPDPIAGFATGARLNDYEVKQMLKMSCFTPGTVLKDETHQCYWHVVQEKHSQRRIRLGARA